MTFQNLPFTAYALGTAPPKFAVKLRRLSDGFYYDFAASQFSASPAQARLNLAVSPAPDEVNIAYGSASIDPAQFTNGLYVVFYYDLAVSTQVACDVDQFFVLDGQLLSPGKADVAGRVMECSMAAHNAKGTLGGMLNDLMAAVQAIRAKVGA